MSLAKLCVTASVSYSGTIRVTSTAWWVTSSLVAFTGCTQPWRRSRRFASWSVSRRTAGLTSSSREPKAKADTTALEREIDRLVYDLYDLTTAEIAVVEESTRAK